MIEDKNGKKKVNVLVEWFDKIAANQRLMNDDSVSVKQMKEKLNSLFGV